MRHFYFALCLAKHWPAKPGELAWLSGIVDSYNSAENTEVIKDAIINVERRAG